MFGRVWTHFWDMLVTFLDIFGNIFGTILDTFLVHVGVIFGTFCGPLFLTWWPFLVTIGPLYKLESAILFVTKQFVCVPFRALSIENRHTVV